MQWNPLSGSANSMLNLYNEIKIKMWFVAQSNCFLLNRKRKAPIHIFCYYLVLYHVSINNYSVAKGIKKNNSSVNIFFNVHVLISTPFFFFRL